MIRALEEARELIGKLLGSNDDDVNFITDGQAICWCLDADNLIEEVIDELNTPDYMKVGEDYDKQ